MNTVFGFHEIMEILKDSSSPEQEASTFSIFRKANKIRRHVFGNDIYQRGVIEFSNFCDKNCLYCGLRSKNRNIERYRLETEEILEALPLLKKHGIGTIVLQSGDDPYYTPQYISRLIKKIKSEINIAVTLSLGDRSKNEYLLFRDSGADRYLLKMETFDKALYEKMKPGQKIEDRLNRIEYLMQLGYEVGSGIIIGLPGMRPEILANDILSISALSLGMIAAGPFIPHPDTPLGRNKQGGLMLSFKVLSLLRVLNPSANIPATSALFAINAGQAVTAFEKGANVLMHSVTPERVRKNYLIYPGKNCNPENVSAHIIATKEMILKSGFQPSSSQGFRPPETHTIYREVAA